jgi:hypothetical protein
MSASTAALFLYTGIGAALSRCRSSREGIVPKSTYALADVYLMAKRYTLDLPDGRPDTTPVL